MDSSISLWRRPRRTALVVATTAALVAAPLSASPAAAAPTLPAPPTPTIDDAVIDYVAPDEDAAVIASDLPVADLDGDNLSEGLEEVLDETDADDTIEVIVQVDGDASVEELAEEIGAFDADNSFESIEAFTAELTPDQIEALAEVDGVEHIEADQLVQTFNQSAGASSGATQVAADFGYDGDRDGPGYTSSDVVVAVIDTGIDNTHVDLDDNKVIGWVDFVGSGGSPYDDNGHGTHIAATVAGTGDGNAAHRGIAPGAALVGVKVLNAAGSGYTSAVIAGIEWAVANRATYGIDVINLSLGTSGCSDGTDATSQAVDAAVAAGIVVAIAAGNSGPGPCTIGSPGAAASGLTVGAVSDLGNGNGFVSATYSAHGPTADGRIKPDISAPGTSITSADNNTGSGYTTSSGTSMATGVVSGVLALMLDASPGATPAQLKTMLRDTSVDYGRGAVETAFGTIGIDPTYGAGVMDAYGAVTAAAGSTTAFPGLAGHGTIEGVVAQGQTLSLPVVVDDHSSNVGASLVHVDITTNTSSTNDLDLTYRQSGAAIATGTSQSRVETLNANPWTNDTHALEIYGYAGTNEFVLDVSGGIDIGDSAPTTPTLTAASRSGATVSASWTSVEGAIAYTVIGSVDGPLHTVGAGATTASFSAPEIATQGISVVAQNWVGASPTSNAVDVEALVTIAPGTVATGFSAQEFADVSEAASRLGMSVEEFVSASTVVIRFLTFLGGDAPVPPVRPRPTVDGPVEVVRVYAGEQLDALEWNAGHFDLELTETQKLTTVILAFLVFIS